MQFIEIPVKCHLIFVMRGNINFRMVCAELFEWFYDFNTFVLQPKLGHIHLAIVNQQMDV